jgi:hypothetical protein
LQCCFNWETLSAVAGTTFWSFYFRLHRRSIRAPQVVEFLDALKRQLRRPLLVIRDRMLAHRSALMRRSVEAIRAGPRSSSSRPAPGSGIRPDFSAATGGSMSWPRSVGRNSRNWGGRADSDEEDEAKRLISAIRQQGGLCFE